MTERDPRLGLQDTGSMEQIDEVEAFYNLARQWEVAINAESDLADAYKLIDAALTELSETYPYYEQLVSASGEGLFPVLDENGNFVNEVWTSAKEVIGICVGPMVMSMSGNTHTQFRVMHKLQVHSNQESPSITQHVAKTYYSFLTLESNLLLRQDVESAWGLETRYLEPSSEIPTLLNKYSKDMKSLLKSTPFRRLPRRKQIKTVDRFLAQADLRMLLRDQFVMADPSYAYYPKIEDGDINLMEIVFEDSSTISGACLGVDSIERLVLENQRIRCNSDMFDADAGLCIVIEPDDDTRSRIDLEGVGILFVPTGSQSFDTEWCFQ